MARINYTFESGGHHNNIVIEPTISDLTIFSIYIINNNNERVNLIKSPIALNSKKIFRYDHTISRFIEIVVGHPSIGSLAIGKDIKIHASLQKFTNNGQFVTPTARVRSGNKVYLYSKIANESSYAIMANLSLNVLDFAGTVIESVVAKIPLNDDRIIAHSTKEKLAYSPYDLKVFSDSDLVDPSLYEIVDGFVIPNKTIDDAVVLYKPLVGVTKLSQNVTIDDNFNIFVNNPLKTYIEYAIQVTLFNTNIDNVNSTPIINQLALVVTD